MSIVKISEIVDALSIYHIIGQSWLDKDSGKIIWTNLIKEGIIGITINDIEENKERYIPLPNEEDMKIYANLLEYVATIPSDIITDDMKNALRTANPYKVFRSTQNKDLYIGWKIYMERKNLELAVLWCKEHSIEYEDDSAVLFPR